MQIDLRHGTSVGVAVRDLEPVLDLYAEGLGLGPFEVLEIETPGAYYLEDGTQRSAPARIRSAER